MALVLLFWDFACIGIRGWVEWMDGTSKGMYEWMEGRAFDNERKQCLKCMYYISSQSRSGVAATNEISMKTRPWMSVA